MKREMSGPDEIKKDNLPEGRETYDAFHQRIEQMRKEAGPGYNPEVQELAGKRLRKLPDLGWTARDHHSVGGSTSHDSRPEDIDKPSIDFLNDEEVLEAMNKRQENIVILYEDKDIFDDNFYQDAIENLKMNLEYLEKIGRLPEEFKGLDVDWFVGQLEKSKP